MENSRCILSRWLIDRPNEDVTLFHPKFPLNCELTRAEELAAALFVEPMILADGNDLLSHVHLSVIRTTTIPGCSRKTAGSDRTEFLTSGSQQEVILQIAQNDRRLGYSAILAITGLYVELTVRETMRVSTANRIR